MNYLAHLLLSGDNDDVLFGNFIGDSIKGKQYNNFSGDVRKGILLHRQIDTFTDSHPIYLKSKRRFYQNFPKISGVITDILYDHLLSLEWEKHSDKSLHQFINQSYKFLDTRMDEMPQRMTMVYQHMRENDWFKRYQSKEGTALSLQQIGKRMGFGENIGHSIMEFEENKDLFIEEFNLFFTDMREDSNSFLEEYQPSDY